MQDPAWRNVLVGKAIEPGPVELVPLASVYQSVPPSAANLIDGELLESRGDWSLVQPSTVPPPPVRIETYG